MDIQNFQKALFDKGKESGFEDMEIFYVTNKSTSVKVQDKEIKNYEITEEGGVSFRGIYQNNMGYSYTETMDEQSVEFLITEARENAQVIEIEDKEEIFAGAARYETLNRYSEAVAIVSPQELIAAAFQMESTALEANPLVKRVIQCAVAKSEGEILIANTKGLRCNSKHTNLSAGIYLMASDGKETATGGEYDFTLKDAARINVKKIAETAVREAVSKLGAESIATGNYPILFRYDMAARLLDSFISVFSGEAVEKGFSLLQGRLGEEIAGKNITIIDDPLQEDVPGGAAFDAEGYPTKKLELIKDGALHSFMHNRKTAKKTGLESTGNAAKKGYSGVISVGHHNVYLQPGKICLEEIIRNIDKGIFIVELQGTNAGINTVSGDFSLYGIGFLIENGKLGRPINQITVSGNFYEMLHNIEEIADDLQIKGTVSSPSIKVKSLTVGGI